MIVLLNYNRLENYDYPKQPTVTIILV